MIYLLDIYYRICYICISILVSAFVFYLNKEIFIFFLALPTQLNFLNYFIFIEPKEIFFLFLYTFIFFCSILSLPYFIFIFFDFLIPAMEQKEFKKVKKYIINFITIFILCSLSSYFIGLPIFWLFFNNLKDSPLYFSFFFEIGGLHYFHYFLSIFNIIFFLQLLFVCNYLLIKQKINLILKYKKYVYAFLIIFCTIITPPDLVWQLILFAILCICFEISFFYFFFVCENIKALKR